MEYLYGLLDLINLLIESEIFHLSVFIFLVFSMFCIVFHIICWLNRRG